MRKFVFFLIFLFFSGITLSFSQEQPTSRIHEVGVAFSSFTEFSHFGILYKTGNKNLLFRFTTLVIDLQLNQQYGRTQDSIDNKSMHAGVGIRAGLEKRVKIIDNFNLVLGSELGLNYSYSQSDNDVLYLKSWQITPMLRFIFGASYQAGQHFVISAEIAPALFYDHAKTKTTLDNTETETTINGFGFGFGNYPAAITLAYRFMK